MVDAAGNRTAKTDQATAVTANYTYDAIYQLLQATQGGNTTESYTYDPVGNRLSSLGVSPYAYNSSNELTSTPNATYTYDYNGNTLTKTDTNGTTQYAWDYENRLTSVTLPGSGGTVTFKYDPFGRRIEKITPSGTSIYAYDGDNLIEETDGNGAVVARYTDGQNIDEPLAMLRAGTTSFYEQDGLGSVTSLTNAAGAVAETYTYDSYGKLTASSGSVTNPFQYTGREYDSTTGLYYYRARYYDPAVGRFPSDDPARFRGAINFYVYSANSPDNFNDPFGLAPEGCTDCKGNPVQGVAAGKRCCANADPLTSSAPDPYPAGYYYVGVSAQFMFQHGGNGPWGNLVRGCLVCMYSHGADANSAHLFCYLNGFHRTTFVHGLSGLVTAVGEANIFILGNDNTLIPMSTGPMVTRY